MLQHSQAFLNWNLLYHTARMPGRAIIILVEECSVILQYCITNSRYNMITILVAIHKSHIDPCDPW